MLPISRNISIPFSDITVSAIRSQGAGGQNVNKVSTAIHLRFDIKMSSLPDVYKKRLLNMSDSRITQEGIIIIKSQQYRSQEKNKEEALKRLQKLIQKAGMVHKKRKPTRPSKNSRQKRLDNKTKRGQLKSLRKKVGLE